MGKDRQTSHPRNDHFRYQSVQRAAPREPSKRLLDGRSQSASFASRAWFPRSAPLATPLSSFMKLCSAS